MRDDGAKRVVLVRHGQTEWNAIGRAQGQTDTPLDHVGRTQAEQAARALAGFAASEVWCSDLQRCRDTARAIAAVRATPLVEIPALRERSFGKWEGQPMADIRRSLAAHAAAEHTDFERMRPPGGESLEDMWRRVDDVFERMRQFPGDLVVVSHGGLMGVLLARLMRGTLQTARSFRLSNACICELEHLPSTDVFRLIRFDDVGHLLANR